MSKTSVVEAVKASDVTEAVALFNQAVARGEDAWEIHLSLFPVVQRVLNPPYINPHLPKMYRIYNEFLPYLEKDDIPGLVRLEITEYARRAKLENLPVESLPSERTTFDAIEPALAGEDWGQATGLLAAFHDQNGGAELARRLLLLGSGYLNNSLGHSISCTAFILLEAIERLDQNPWPAFATLTDYFHKGRFFPTPPLHPEPIPDNEIEYHLLRATSGRGIVNLHHTITIYAIDRVRRFFTTDEYNHLIRSWVGFLGAKEAEEVSGDGPKVAPPADYSQFYGTFETHNARAVLSSLKPMLDSEDGRSRTKRYLVKGVCDQYQGDYNPHYLTGLGSTFWLLDRYKGGSQVVINGLYQYLDYFFSDLKA